MSEKHDEAEVLREYGPFPGVERVHGVTYDGESVWFATDGGVHAVDPESGKAGRKIDIPADAGTAYDGQHLFQLAGGVIQKIDPSSGAVLATLPSPAGKSSSGLTWAEGSLWVANYHDRKILQVDPKSGEVLRTLPSSRFVTGVTFLDGELWHATWENEESELRHISKESGEVLESVMMPNEMKVSGLESNGQDLFYCGSGGTAGGKVRVVRRPKRKR